LLVADCDPDRKLVETLLPKLASQRELNVGASVGDAAEVLAGVFEKDPSDRSLAALARELAANAEAFA
jgi:hypothetical protein